MKMEQKTVKIVQINVNSRKYEFDAIGIVREKNDRLRRRTAMQQEPYENHLKPALCHYVFPTGSRNKYTEVSSLNRHPEWMEYRATQTDMSREIIVIHSRITGLIVCSHFSHWMRNLAEMLFLFYAIALFSTLHADMHTVQNRV